MSLTKSIKKAKAQIKRQSKPLWTGPSGEGPNGGVTQGLLGRFLGCRERFRLHAVEGIRPRDKFSPYLEFGNLWHVCEEHLASLNKAGGAAWLNEPTALANYCKDLSAKYPFQREEIGHWHDVTLALFPEYVAHWSKHPDVLARTPLLQEQTFDVLYRLPSGRAVRLRGKWDSVDLVGDGKEAGVWLQENKTKSAISAEKIEAQLKFDLQTQLYLIALKSASSSDLAKKGWSNQTVGKGIHDLNTFGAPIKGIRYNVVRRGAHKTVDSMMKKFGEDSRNGRIGEWFARWNVEVSAADIQRFKDQTLNPLLEHLCLWYDHVVAGKPFEPRSHTLEGDVSLHWRMPYGVYDPVAEGGFGDVDAYLDSGSMVGLHRTEVLFPELEES